jgi:hypothetical protein
MCAPLFKHGFDYTTVWWIRATLEGCPSAVTLNGFSKRVAVSRGCPQERALSPLLWCFFVDDLIARLNGDGIYNEDYVDYICFIAVQKFPNMVLGLMQ